MDRRTQAYWPTRIMLTAGFVATAVVLALSLALALSLVPGIQEPMFGELPSVGGLPLRVGSLVGDVPALVGLLWMPGIFRGPRDEAPAWRYRERG